MSQFYLWDMVENRPLNAAYTSLSEANEARKMYSNPDRYGVMTGKFEEAARASAPVAGKPAVRNDFHVDDIVRVINNVESSGVIDALKGIKDTLEAGSEGVVTQIDFLSDPEGHCIEVNFPNDVIWWLEPKNLAPQPATSQAANETAEGREADDDQTFAELCEREIVKIRSLTLHDDEYTGDLLAYAVGSPVGITMCVEARMKQIADLQGEVERLKKQIKKLKHKSSLDDGFIDYLTQESDE